MAVGDVTAEIHGFSEPDSTPTPWATGMERLRAADTYWLSTVRPDGRPHVTPLIAVWHRQALWFATKGVGLGNAFTKRDESARTFEGVFTLHVPRDPGTWASVEAQPVPQWTLDIVAAGGALSTLGKAIGPGLLNAAKMMGVPLPSQLDGPNAEFNPELLIKFMRQICWHLFPRLEPSDADF
jgi:Pyridoxamine 5'-phosphate oxidase